MLSVDLYEMYGDFSPLLVCRRRNPTETGNHKTVRETGAEPKLVSRGKVDATGEPMQYLLWRRLAC